MKSGEFSLINLLDDLKDRARELTCLYTIEEELVKPETTVDGAMNLLVRQLPFGFQYPSVCKVKVWFQNAQYYTPDFQESPWYIDADILIRHRKMGTIRVYYTEEMPEEDRGPFTEDEKMLLNNIANRMSHFIFYHNLKNKLELFQSKEKMISSGIGKNWKVLLDLLQTTDKKLYMRITRKMLYSLCMNNILPAWDIMHHINENSNKEETEEVDPNKPAVKRSLARILEVADDVYFLAQQNMAASEILQHIQNWILEEKSLFLIQTLESLNTSFKDIADALTRFHHMHPDTMKLPQSLRHVIRVSLSRRFFTEQLDFINIAKKYVRISDFIHLLERIVYPTDGHGKLGGKSAGLFVASRILYRERKKHPEFEDIKTPRTWYITSDVLLDFIHYNNLEDVIEQKYKPIDEVRLEYPFIEQVFKNSDFPPEIIRGLSLILEDIGENPIIVRSSSLLEDRFGTAFSGKYKSLFLANQGSFSERLEALQDAVAEVYASVFGPDPIEYRSERNLLDFNEEMGIMVMQVVGKKLGKYYFPAFAGVAFSKNEFRWSPRIHREDGLIRLVPGLGTRAVDRLSDDYPILIAPGQPNLRVNVSPEEMVRYSPHKMDVINLETNTFKTVDTKEVLKEVGRDYPALNQLISVQKDGHISKPIGFNFDPKKDDVIFTFEGLISGNSFAKKIHKILTVLEEDMETPVDIEFASDGENLYLLQCRPQNAGKDAVSIPIPKNIDKNKILFTANKFVSAGLVPDIRYIVYVDPDGYNNLSRLEDLQEIGRIIGRLNKLLPKRSFILMGPGRWGSRGDIKLGVSVTYSDINNTAMLVEIARQKGNYVPDLSFGTHFFQDLVESGIRYLPLYPDEDGNIFNESIIKKAPNHLVKLLPEDKKMAHVVQVVDVKDLSEKGVLRIAMDADNDKAMAWVRGKITGSESDKFYEACDLNSELFWEKMAELLRRLGDMSKVNIEKIFLLRKITTDKIKIEYLIVAKGPDSVRKKLAQLLDVWKISMRSVMEGTMDPSVEKILEVTVVDGSKGEIPNKFKSAIQILQGTK